MTPGQHPYAVFICIALAVLQVACRADKKEPSDNCDDYRLRYITDVRYENGQPFINRFSMGYEDDGKLITRYTIFNADTFPSDYAKLNNDGQVIEYGNVPHPSSPTLRTDYFYQSGQVTESQYWSSISPGAPIQLAQTSFYYYTNGLLTKIENYAPNQSDIASQIDQYYEGNAKIQVHYGLPNHDTLTAYKVHFSNIPNPLKELESPIYYFGDLYLIDTLYTKQPDGIYKPISFFEYETEDNRVLRAKTYQMGNPVELTRDIVYEYECY